MSFSFSVSVVEASSSSSESSSSQESTTAAFFFVAPFLSLLPLAEVVVVSAADRLSREISGSGFLFCMLNSSNDFSRLAVMFSPAPNVGHPKC